MIIAIDVGSTTTRVGALFTTDHTDAGNRIDFPLLPDPLEAEDASELQHERYRADLDTFEHVIRSLVTVPIARPRIRFLCLLDKIDALD